MNALIAGIVALAIVLAIAASQTLSHAVAALPF
jgi:hypothetical protein